MLSNWRKAGNRVPVIILTALDAWHNRVDGFRAGADDYLGKPFHVEELLERVKALIRRANDMQDTALQPAGTIRPPVLSGPDHHQANQKAGFS